MPKQEPQPTPRTFTKKVGDETHTRTVHTEADKVQALYDGYTEQKTSKPSSSSESSSTGGSKPSGSSSS